MRRVIWIAVVGLLGLGLLLLWRQAVLSFGESDLHVLRVLIMRRLHLIPTEEDEAAKRAVVMATDVHREAPISVDPSIAPFREIGASLGERASGNALFRTRGAVIFDANGDGRMDVFLPQAGQTVGFETDKNLLTDKPLKRKPCVLYLNQGNDADGN